MINPLSRVSDGRGFIGKFEKRFPEGKAPRVVGFPKGKRTRRERFFVKKVGLFS